MVLQLEEAQMGKMSLNEAIQMQGNDFPNTSNTRKYGTPEGTYIFFIPKILMNIIIRL